MAEGQMKMDGKSCSHNRMLSWCWPAKGSGCESWKMAAGPMSLFSGIGTSWHSCFGGSLICYHHHGLVSHSQCAEGKDGQWPMVNHSLLKWIKLLNNIEHNVQNPTKPFTMLCNNHVENKTNVTTPPPNTHTHNLNKPQTTPQKPPTNKHQSKNTNDQQMTNPHSQNPKNSPNNYTPLPTTLPTPPKNTKSQTQRPHTTPPPIPQTLQPE